MNSDVNSLRRKYQQQSKTHFYTRQRRVYKDVFGNIVNMNRGGHLMNLCGYETLSICLVIVLATLVLASSYDEWQKRAMLYWIRTLYGFLSIPFLPFKIPLVATLLMHTEKMGYDKSGRTVISATTDKENEMRLKKKTC